jgi:alpha-ribazole phosphatase
LVQAETDDWQLALGEGAGAEVWLVRHGETQWNRDQRIQGHLDVELTERGREQARRLAAWMAAERLDAVYSSDLQRARETAEILAAGRAQPVTIEPRFRESGFGVFQGLTTAEIAERFPEAFQAWRADALRHRPPGGETLEDLWERCYAALREHLPKHPGGRVAVVAHGGPVRVMTCALLGLPLAVYPKLRVENTAVTRILFTRRGTVLAGFNDVSHLKSTASAPQHSGWEEK